MKAECRPVGRVLHTQLLGGWGTAGWVRCLGGIWIVLCYAVLRVLCNFRFGLCRAKGSVVVMQGGEKTVRFGEKGGHGRQGGQRVNSRE